VTCAAHQSKVERLGHFEGSLELQTFDARGLNIPLRVGLQTRTFRSLGAGGHAAINA
jgi:hypothetical protein